MKFTFSQKKGTPRKNRSPLTMSETQRFLMLSILIGVFAGLLVVCFHITMEFISWYSLGTLAEMTHTGTLLSPALGATISAFLVFFVFKKAHGSGVTQTKAAYYIYDGYVPFSTVIGKFLACSISIGSGNSLGPEDPTIQMGAGIASLLGRCFRLGRESKRLIAPVGAAAGLAAVFNAPITRVLFVMEEVIAGWHAGVLGSIILSSTAAGVVVRWFLGNAPLFTVPQFQLRNPLELIVYALVGVFTGLLSVVFVEAVGSLRHLQERFPGWTRYLLPGTAGLLVGVAGIWYPEIMGAGYDAIDSALHNRFSWSALLIIGLLKIVATILCSSARTPGGMFAPTLIAGAMIGGALGGISQHLQLFPTSATDAYVLVGMGVNVNVDLTDHPEIASMATSLMMELGREVSREALAAAILNQMEAVYLAAQAGEPLHREWRARLSTLGRQVRVRFGRQVEEGLAEDVDADGNLLLRRADGSRVAITAGDVTLRA